MSSLTQQMLRAGAWRWSTQARAWRAAAAGPVVAVVTLLAAVVTTDSVGLPLRDPHHVAERRFAVAAAIVAALIALDLVVRRGRRRWTPGRALAVAAALVSFHVTYLAYRNLKSVVPVARPGELVDGGLGDLDRWLFAGHDPAELVHGLLGTGAAAHALSAVYMLFFTFVPVALALALVGSADLRAGLFVATALALNWAIGAAGYFLVPALGPIYADPAVFADLPATRVSHLQQALIDERATFLADPSAGGAAQSIGAFPSLHVSIVLTAALAAELLRAARPLRIAAWALVALTVTATVYFGWHYLLDDVGGAVVAVAALAVARLLTGFDPRSARRLLALARK